MKRGDDRIIELLSAYIDGEVTDLECAEAERLLREDPEAAALYERLKAATGLLNGLDKVEAPPSLQRGVLLHLAPGKQTGFAERLRKLMQPRVAPVPLLSFSAAIIIVIALAFFATTRLFYESPIGPETGGERMAAAEPIDEEKREGDSPDEAATEEFEIFIPPDTAAGAEEETEAETLADVLDADEMPAEAAAPAAARETRSEALRSPGRSVMARDRESAGEPILGAVEPSFFVADQHAVEDVVEGDVDDDYAAEFYVSETVTYITERGAPIRLDYAAPPGSDTNPLTDTTTFLPPRFLEFEFIGRGNARGRGEISVFVETHVARDGTIIYLRMVGQRSSKQLIEDLADRLMATRLIPARGEQDWVSVFYSFVAVIKPAN